ncbi:hypothetical protein [Kutzneria kofuensis]|uniref:hypothetical protein n=1 Tax=Kutzneria kofuensis TaxID=103725 RepID=UPI0031EFCBDB
MSSKVTVGSLVRLAEMLPLQLGWTVVWSIVRVFGGTSLVVALVHEQLEPTTVCVAVDLAAGGVGDCQEHAAGGRRRCCRRVSGSVSCGPPTALRVCGGSSAAVDALAHG